MSRRKPKFLGKSRRNVETYDVPIGDPVEAAAALKAVSEARAALFVLRRSSGTPEQVADAEAALKVAEAATAEFRDRVTFTALPSAQYEALINANPVPDFSDANPRPDGWYWPLFDHVAAACGDVEMSAEQWAAEVASWGAADQSAFTQLLRRLHETAANAALPKG